jgi:phosphoglycerol transferase MdoB-like AlkP superfamily enzyme
MEDRISHFFKVYFFFIVVFVLEKILFIVYHYNIYKQFCLSDLWNVILHGFSLDASIAGYLTVIPSLLLIAASWILPSIIRGVERVYFGVVLVMLSLIFILDLLLYKYWGFRLDATPFFYFFSSPINALASISIWFVVLGIISFALLSFALYRLACFYLFVDSKPKRPLMRRDLSLLVLLVLAGLLVIPIRGGVTVSTMSIGQAYFSDKVELNHAAINPAFSLMESFVKEADFKSQYRFFGEDKANALFAKAQDVAVDSKDSIPQLFTTPHPNVIIVIMESFMSKTMASLGGIPNVATHLDELGKKGILFTNIYANSFRTDRGVVSILSGYPGQPTTSIMKYPKKTQSLPSIPRSLKKAGYDLGYYYGGDINFTNTRAYLVSMGIDKIVSDKDFPISRRLSKWGAHDHIVFERALGDIKSGQYREPFLRVIQTSSSHEPFEVPFKRLKDPYLNSVAYTDSSIGQFINHLKTTSVWKNTVVILVPDHAAHYPQQIKDDSPDRYKIPLIMTGGAVRQPMKVDVFASQIDIAATLLHQLGISSKEFTFSKNILNPSSPHFGFFTFPNLFGFITSDSQTVFDCDGNRVVLLNGKNATQNLDRGKAFLQKLYDDLGSR